MKTIGHFLFFCALSALFRPAMAIDLQPGDIVAPLPNRTLVTVSYINSQNNDLYRNGVNTGANPKLESNSALIRLTHTYSIGSLPAVSYLQTGTGVLLPMAHLRLFLAVKG